MEALCKLCSVFIKRWCTPRISVIERVLVADSNETSPATIREWEIPSNPSSSSQCIPLRSCTWTLVCLLSDAQ